MGAIPIEKLGKVDYVDCLERVRFFGSSVLVLCFCYKRTFEIDLYLPLLVSLLLYKRCNRTRVDACIVLEELWAVRLHIFIETVCYLLRFYNPS
jgi:hypothetical protein